MILYDIFPTVLIFRVCIICSHFFARLLFLLFYFPYGLKKTAPSRDLGRCPSDDDDGMTHAGL